MRTRVTCLTDYNGDFTINILDLSSVLADHQAGDPAADYNEDGVVNQFDQVDFLNQYNPTEGGTCENRSFTYDYRDQLIETAIFDGSAHVSTTTHFYDALKRRTVESLDLPPPAPTGDLGEELRRFVYAGCHAGRSSRSWTAWAARRRAWCRACRTGVGSTTS
jgi:hypothetical protein